MHVSNLNQASSKNNVQQISRADRLAELRKQSQESVKKTESILEPSAPEVSTPEPPVEEESPIEDVVDHTADETIELVADDVAEEILTSKNVFKEIVTKTSNKRDTRRRRRSRYDDSGGGRQPKIKKLNRQRYNDYKYAARDILEDETVAEEHRSNLLGQIWAKGERIGVDATLEFIDEKQEQLIINEEVAKRLRDLVKLLTTRR